MSLERSNLQHSSSSGSRLETRKLVICQTHSIQRHAAKIIRAPSAAATDNSKQSKSSKSKVSKESDSKNADSAPPMTGKQQLYGTSWTGKTPLNLLHEHCQKQGWKNPFSNVVKTRAVAAATFGLHRVCHNTSAYRLLPPTQRDLWLKFEGIRKSCTGPQAELDYATDPFLAQEIKEREMQKLLRCIDCKETFMEEMDVLRSIFDNQIEINTTDEGVMISVDIRPEVLNAIFEECADIIKNPPSLTQLSIFKDLGKPTDDTYFLNEDNTSTADTLVDSTVLSVNPKSKTSQSSAKHQRGRNRSKQSSTKNGRLSDEELRERLSKNKLSQVTLLYFVEKLAGMNQYAVYCRICAIALSKRVADERMLLGDPTLTGISHVIVDEVHERSVESDFAHSLRDLLQKELSACYFNECNHQCRYFFFILLCSVMTIPGFTYPVTDLHLENILTERNKLLRIDHKLIAATVSYICKNHDDGAILIFLPGVSDIKHQLVVLNENCDCHNIAETSITIDDVVFVIDSGKVKEITLRNEVSRMNPFPEPEILQTPLEQLCLQIRAMNVQDITNFLFKIRKQFSDGESDLLTACKVFDEWVQLPTSQRRDFCSKNYLSHTNLENIADRRLQFRDILVDIGYLEFKEYNVSSTVADPNIVKVVIVADCILILLESAFLKKQYEQIAHGTVAIDSRARDIHYFTKDDGRVFIHPSSINFETTKYQYGHLAFNRKLATSKIFILDPTPASPISILMFGGAIDTCMMDTLLLLEKLLVSEHSACHGAYSRLAAAT
ncbi:hypothetical protein BSLG_006009 [Batrachochytrium salamandrivorans]|nr:hypothetical protein BSLG_006009 [Batrachochytrium salamandrivorans]